MFDPQRLAEGVPAGLRWSPVRGCHDPLTAMIRANGLAAATGLSAGGVESGGFWAVSYTHLDVYKRQGQRRGDHPGADRSPRG